MLGVKVSAGIQLMVDRRGDDIFRFLHSKQTADAVLNLHPEHGNARDFVL